MSPQLGVEFRMFVVLTSIEDLVIFVIITHGINDQLISGCNMSIFHKVFAEDVFLQAQEVVVESELLSSRRRAIEPLPNDIVKLGSLFNLGFDCFYHLFF